MRKLINNIIGKNISIVVLFSILTIGLNAQVIQPNIVFILVDDLGYGDLSVNGGTDIKTPNIDQLFKSGVTFNNFYSNSTVCSPTRASLITGRYPDLVGVPGVIRGVKDQSWGYLCEYAITLPDILNKAGYETALIGKWHLGLEGPNTPNERGFKFFHGFLGGMMHDYYNHLQHGNNYMRKNDSVVNAKGHATDVFSDWAIDYINVQKNTDSPFFMLLAYNAPHYPIQPPKEWYEKVKNREKDISDKRAKNVALVEHLDDGIGRVIKALKASGQYENTIIVFSSDNGGHLPSEASNGNLRGGKIDMYEGGIKVPTCMVWNNRIESNSTSNVIGVTMDFYATLTYLAGIEINHEVDAINLMPDIGDKTIKKDDRTIYFVRRAGYKYSGLCYYAVRKGDYKLVQNSPFEEFQLFNIVEDPLETIPLDDNPKEFHNLRYQLSQHIRKAGAIPWQKKEK
ncbi:MAG: N-acetylgalactosamine 6-sulfate sulfatase [Cryomorphaceae bacterium BACL22 MAG-120619-bin32]|jgi:arylsulfatase A-like enzyme|nr:MAG: N-acetylgalactosamine 6-sulfate sulfatase [Cryomorphaceae bacterium BACL22 MAG-120619-bin32]